MWRWCIVLVACGRPPPPAPSAPVPVPVAIVPDAATAALIDAPIDAPIDAAPPEPVAAGCRGGAIVSDLSHLDPCVTTHRAEPLPDPVKLSIEPDPIVVRSGGDASVKLVIANHGGSAAELYLDDDRERLSTPDVEIYNATSRVDLLGDPCSELSAVMDHVLHVSVPAHGRVTLAFLVHARVRRVNGACGYHPVGPLAPGRYRLEIDAPQGTVNAALVVR